MELLCKLRIPAIYYGCYRPAFSGIKVKRYPVKYINENVCFFSDEFYRFTIYCDNHTLSILFCK